MPRRYRVWTRDWNGHYERYTCHTDWLTTGQCRAYMLGRWGHLPGAAHISSADSYTSFERVHGKLES